MPSDATNWWDVLTNKTSWAIYGAISGFVVWVFTAGRKVQKFHNRIESIEKRQTTLESDHTSLVTTLAKINDGINQRLYHQDGSLIYMPAEMCEKCREKCQKNIERSLDEIKQDVKQLISLHTKESHKK